jgi:hypothetical protein
MPHVINLLISLKEIVVKIDFKTLDFKKYRKTPGTRCCGSHQCPRKGDTVKHGSMRKAEPSVVRQHAAAKTCV